MIQVLVKDKALSDEKSRLKSNLIPLFPMGS